MPGTPTNFILGYAGTLAVAVSGSPTDIAQIKSISYSGDQADYSDITNLSSPTAAAGGPPVREYAPSLITPSTCTVTGILEPEGDAGQTLISASFNTQTLLHFTHTFALAPGQTTPATRTYTGYVSKKPVMNSSLQDAVSFDFEVRITGVITDTLGS